MNIGAIAICITSVITPVGKYPKPRPETAIISAESPISHYILRDKELKIIQNEFIEAWSKDRLKDEIVRRDNVNIKATIQAIQQYDVIERGRLNAMPYFTISSRKRMFGLFTENSVIFDNSNVNTGFTKVYKINSAIFTENGILCHVSSSRGWFSIEPLEIMYVELKTKKAYFCIIAHGLKFNYRLAPLANTAK